ncbi:MAG TPA: SGNH/GDSL hydrolase family protein [Opitutaceae bacterium]
MLAALCALACGLTTQASGAPDDWPNLGKYREDNARVLALPAGGDRVVFLGDSITEFWSKVGTIFQRKPYINRGISGQTTPQILLRFRPDVVALAPRVVLILAGTNDVAGNTGPSTPAMIEGNLASMAEIARENDIRVVLCSILPAFDYPWKPGLQPAEKIVELNQWIRTYAENHHCVYLDYFAAMADGRHGMKAEYSEDGVHPNAAGYAVMEPLAEKAISEALSTR